MEVLVVLPWHKTDKSYRSKYSTLLSYAPLTLGSIATIIKNANSSWNIEVWDEISKPVNYDKKHYDIVFISCTTPVVKRGYEIAKEFKKRNSYIVMGGYHVKYMHKESLEYADTVIIGAGEYSLKQFVEDFEKGNQKQVYDMQNVNGKDILEIDRKFNKMKKYLKYPAIIANNGCPNNCSFCVISDMWRYVAARPIENVIEEIKKLKSKIIIFFDPHFFANREYSIKLMTELEKLKINWVGSTTIDKAFDEELMCLAQKSGCSGLLVGLESLSTKALNKVHKGFNDPSKYKEAISRMQAHGISVNGCFVLGLDEDTEEILLSIPEQVNYLNLNLARFAIMTPVPNSNIYNELEKQDRIIDRNWNNYTQHKAVFKPKNMSPKRLEEIYKYVWKETYSYKNIYKRFKNIPNKTLKEKLICLGANIGFKFLGME